MTGSKTAPTPAFTVASALAQLAASPYLREMVAKAGVAAARGRSWPAAMAELAAGYDHALSRFASASGAPADAQALLVA